MQTTTDVLLGLPSELASSILLTWLDLREVPAVDTAFCNKEMRAAFLNAMACPQFTLPGMDYMSDTANFLMWINSRNVAIEKLVVCNDLDDKLIEYLEKLGHRTKSIYVHETVFEDTDCRNAQLFDLALKRCPNLHSLTVENCRITLSVAKSISECSTLRTLHFTRKNDCDAPAKKVNSMVFSSKLQLDLLHFSGNSFGVINLFLRMVDLSTLRSLCAGWTNRPTTTLIKNKIALCTDLKALEIHPSSSAKFNDKDLTSMLSACPQLHYFSFSGERLTAACAPFIAKTLPQLRTIRMNKIGFPNELLIELATHRADSLEGVYIRDCPVMINEGLNVLLKECTKLSTLSFLPHRSFRFNVSLLGNITTLILDMDKCQDTAQVLHAISPYCKKLIFLGIIDGIMIKSNFALLGRDLSVFPALRYLDLYVTNFDRPGWKSVFFLSGLRARRPKLSVRWNRNILNCEYDKVLDGIVRYYVY